MSKSGSRAILSLAAGIVTAIFRFSSQYLLIPVYIAHWGVAAYGEWAILYALIPLFLMIDGGLSGVLGARLSQHISNKDYPRAGASFTAATLFTGVLITAAVTAVLVAHFRGTTIIGGVKFSAIQNWENTQTFLSLAAICKIITSQSLSWRYGQGKYHQVSAVHATIFGLELLAGAVLVLGFNALPDRLALFIFGINATASTSLVLFSAIPSLVRANVLISSTAEEARYLIPRGIGILMFGASNFLNANGFLYLAGVSFNSSLLGMLAAMRNTSKLPEQACNLTYSTVQAEVAYSYSSDIYAARRIFALSLYANFSIAVAFSTVAVFAALVINRAVAINASAALVVILVIGGALRGIQTSCVAVSTGTLTHRSLSLVQIVLTAAVLGGCMLTKHFQTPLTLSIAFTALDLLVTLVALYHAARALGISTPGALLMALPPQEVIAIGLNKLEGLRSRLRSGA